MKALRPTLAVAALSAFVSGCSGNPTSGNPTIHSINPLSTGKLQIAVGTANLFGSATGLNVVSTYRQSDGLSNVLVDTPTIKGPFALPAAQAAGGGDDPYSTLPAGPSAEEVAVGGEITGTSQSVPIGSPACDSTTPCTEANANGGTTTIAPNTSTFGQAGGVFTDGISPGNAQNNGKATSYVPYTEPLYDTLSPDPNAFVPFAGPPAFAGNNGLGTRDGTYSLGAGVLGTPLGITVFQGVTPSAGSYSLSVQVPTGFSGAQETYGTAVAPNATLSSTAVLPTLTAPAFTEDGKGGGTFTIGAFPAGVTEELVEFVDYGDGSDAAETCQGPLGATIDNLGGGAGPVYYTVLVKAPGNFTLPDTIGPNTDVKNGASTIVPSESICTAAANQASSGSSSDTGDVYSVQVIGADYPLWESLYPQNAAQTPTLTGASGQSDITVSAVGGPFTAAAKVRAELARSRMASRTRSSVRLIHSPRR